MVSYREKNVEQRPKSYSRPVGFLAKKLDAFEKVRYLLRPGEEEDGDTRRATDPVWSTESL